MIIDANDDNGINNNVHNDSVSQNTYCSIWNHDCYLVDKNDLINMAESKNGLINVSWNDT